MDNVAAKVILWYDYWKTGLKPAVKYRRKVMFMTQDVLNFVKEKNRSINGGDVMQPRGKGSGKSMA